MKKGTKLLSVLLAFVMVISMFAATFAASAADYYKPRYTEKITEEDVSLMLGDINTLLPQLLTGDILEDVYKVLPSLSTIVNNGGQQYSTRRASYYAEAYPERFANLASYTDDPDGVIVDDVTDADGNITTPGTFTKFFEENPITCADLAAFQAEVNEIVDMVVIDNVMSTIAFAFAFFASDKVPAGRALADGVDQICEALGVEQTANLQTLLGLSEEAFMQTDTAGTRTYLKNIVAALLPDLSNNVMKVLRNVADETKGAQLYAGVTAVLNNLSDVVNALSSSLSSLMDITAVVEQIDNLKTQFAALPTVGEGETLRLDLQGIIGQLVPTLTQQLAGIELKIVFVDRAEHDPVAPTTKPLVPDIAGALSNGIEFRSMQLDRLANCETTADVLKTIYDYLYDNLIADPDNNALIEFVLPIVGSMEGVQIPQTVLDFIGKALAMDNDELAGELNLVLANAAGRHIMTLVPATAATCVADGSMAYYVCEACGQWFADEAGTELIADQSSVIIPAAEGDHDIAAFEAKAPTCTEAGNIAHYACVLCGKLFADAEATEELTAEEVAIAATGHTPAEHYYADPDGHALICETCGVTLESGAHVDEDGDGLCDVCAFEIPAEPEEPTEPTTGADDETPVKDADIPKTGSAASIGFGALSLAAAGALVLLRVRSKKNDII